jgi:hypothetical protein
MKTIAATPDEAPHHVENFLQPEAREQSKIAAATCNIATALPCSIPVTVCLFFDGTNSMERARDGKRTGLPDPKAGIPALLSNTPLTPEECSHSNVARLFSQVRWWPCCCCAAAMSILARPMSSSC